MPSGASRAALFRDLTRRNRNRLEIVQIVVPAFDTFSAIEDIFTVVELLEAVDIGPSAEGAFRRFLTHILLLHKVIADLGSRKTSPVRTFRSGREGE